MNNFNGKDVLYPFLTHKNVRIMKLVLIMLTVMYLGFLLQSLMHKVLG